MKNYKCDLGFFHDSESINGETSSNNGVLARPLQMYDALVAVQKHFNTTTVSFTKDRDLDMCKKMKVVGFDIN